jgi:hypothetical protein
MKSTRFEDLPLEEQDWIDAYVDGTITEEAFSKLQERLLRSPGLRSVMRRSLSLRHELQNLGATGDTSADSWLHAASEQDNVISVPGTTFTRWLPIAAAAGLAFLLGLTFMGLRTHPIEEARLTPVPTETEEHIAEGFAVVKNLIDAEWPEQSDPRQQGDTLGAEVFRLKRGLAEIQFFCGASMTVQGPAEIALRSAWEATCREGAVRVQVPPAARGFKLHGPSTEIVDLGTEFGLSVRDGKAHVEVFDGEIEFRHLSEAARLAKRGSAWGLPANGHATPSDLGEVIFPDVRNFTLQARAQRHTDFELWQSHRDALARDPRLIAYYTFERDDANDLIANVAQPRNPEFDGAVVLAETTDGRWPGRKQALEFRRPGSRVRVRIPGEFSAFTFMCWARIDSLDRRYNALFMGDGYETGEPHWQIRDDGSLMLSVMVDDTRPSPFKADDAGFHRVYFSPPIWDRSMAGQWMHLTSVFDPANRQVSHFVNGRRVSRMEIVDEYLIKSLRIGNGEIGNWGQPFRESPWFAIRNLNGRIDELAILNAALSDDEVGALHSRSRAGRH